MVPYIRKYIGLLTTNVQYDVIYLNRDGITETLPGVRHMYGYSMHMNIKQNKIKKLVKMIQFVNFCKKIICKNQYDRIILLHTNAAILLAPTLINRYSGRYIIDVRDYSWEKNPIYYLIESKLMRHAGLRVVSSMGYCKFLPPAEYQMVHNDFLLDEEYVRHFRQNRCSSKSDCIRINFIGYVRYFKQNEILAKVFSKDTRFMLGYYGKNADIMKTHVGHLVRSEFHDHFPPEETLSFYEKTDIINNVYGNHTPMLDYAYSNKLYYSCILGIPILVSPDTYMADIVKQYGIGFVFDEDDPNICDKLFEYYQAIDWEQFDKRCDAFYSKVCEENKMFEQNVTDFLVM